MDYDVVVAGAGPVGLMLAAELGSRGVRPVVVERLAEPDQTIKAGAINVPAWLALRRLGLGPRLRHYQEVNLHRVLDGIPADRRPDPAEFRAMMAKVGGHFGGLFKLDASTFDEDDDDLDPGVTEAIAMITQQQLEEALGALVADLGVPVLRGVELVGFTEDDAAVTVELAGETTLRAPWLVGCDGGRSRVRKLAGFDFPGTAPTITGHQAIVDMDRPELLPQGWNRTRVGTMVHGPFPGRILLVQPDGPPADRDAPITRHELQAALTRVSETDVRIEHVHSATRFTDNARQVPDYRSGRVLLAGDAAHVHSPFGGQGLNLGVGDAANLGWKLAAVVHGWAAEDLLDSYTAERHPIGARVLQLTRAQVALMRTDEQSAALREIVSELMDLKQGNEYFVKMIGGLVQRYDLGGGHRWIGRRMPDLALTDGTSLSDWLTDGAALLLDGADEPAVRELGAAWPDRLRTHTAGARAHPDLAAMLIRPDGYVAWAADGKSTVEELEAALRTWCGPARQD